MTDKGRPDLASSAGQNNAMPVITIDGPTASGKGTVAQAVAQELGWEVLDSGALYRLTALACLQQNTDVSDEQAVAQVAKNLNVRFDSGQVFYCETDVTRKIREEDIGKLASHIAAFAPVREALLARQRAFRTPKGLVADGRDMGTVVFPDAQLKIFLVADARSRAKRRCKQLKDKGFSANLADLIQDMLTRDQRDYTRANAPLLAAPGAKVIDSSDLSISETVQAVLDHWSIIRSAN